MIALSVVSGFVLALTAPLLLRLFHHRTGWILALLPIALTVFYAGHVGPVSSGLTFYESHVWVAALGIHFSFLLDGLSLVFSLLIAGIGTLIVIYSGGYLHGTTELGRFYMYILAFMASMLGLVLASNFITLFIFWELTSLTSYLLIGFEHRRASAREAALQALLVTGIGGLVLLAGFLLIGQVAGTLEMAELLTRPQGLGGNSLYVPILILVLVGAFTKSAQTPFHFWLPSAMEGPTPVSAFLHSATMVKAGVYLLLRMTPVLGGTELWQILLTTFGGVTMVLGAAMALFQTDLKRLLAYTTVNGLGMLVFLTGLPSRAGITAALVFLVTHALYKGSLFLTAGVVDHETGTRDIRQLRGLYTQMPLVTVAALLAALSMAGLPPLLGFIAKESIYEATWHLSRWTLAGTAAAVTANMMLFAAAGLFVLRPFFGRSGTADHHDHHPIPISLWLGPLVLAVMGLLGGLLPGLVDGSVISPGVSAVLQTTADIHLSLFHGITPMLGLSALTVILGAALYGLHPKLSRWVARRSGWARFGPAAWYEHGLGAVKHLAEWQTLVLQSGHLHIYILIILLATMGGVGATLILREGLVVDWQPDSVRVYEIIVVILMLVAALVTIRSDSRLSAIVAVGVVGYGMALLFIDFGAPDLAMTQFIIETMTVILFALIIYHLPKYRSICSRAQRVRNALVAVAGGGLMTLLLLIALTVQRGSRLADFFKENSLISAHGRNIVNVIIVDFRGMDTLGEITVLAIAGAGVYTLLKLRLEGRNR
ncbi:Na(+) H(+) antiporter subunit A [Olavius algarvensis associated proteobacterium Delta 3]|nr:Na(+) H(+) antiporter subunit A [Olavius algarvensis associated proteobacterium Delta 3]